MSRTARPRHIASRWSFTEPAAIDAVIFDLDGVLTDTEPVHLRALRRMLAPSEVSERTYETLVGAGVMQTMQWIKQTYGREESVERLRELYSRGVLEELRRSRLEPLPGARRLIATLRNAEVPIAVASQSQPEWVEATLESSGLDRYFPVVVTSDLVPRPKPAPDVYLMTADRLGVEPGSCLAIEDSVAGIASARRAGMTVVQLRAHRFAARPQPGAHYVIRSLEDFDLAWLGLASPDGR